MKKFISLSLAALLTVAGCGVASAENVNIDAERNTINVVVNGKAVEADNYLILDRTYIPLRAVSEMLGKNVIWEESTYTAYINDDFSVNVGGDVVGKINNIDVKSNLLNGYVNYFKTLEKYKDMSVEQITEEAKKTIAEAYAAREMASKYDIFVDKTFESNYANQVFFMQMQKGGEAAYRNELLKYGYTEDFLKYMREVDYLKSKLTEKHLFDVTDEEIVKYYNDNYDAFAMDGYSVKYLRVPFGEDKTAAKASIDAYYSRLQAGEDFDKIADEIITLTPARASKNAMFSKSDNPDTFIKTVMELEDGKYSAPIEYNDYYLIAYRIGEIDHMDVNNGDVRDMIYNICQTQKTSDHISATASAYASEWN